MAESVRGGTAAPHPATKQTNTVTLVPAVTVPGGLAASGTFGLKIEGLGRSVTAPTIAINSTAAALKGKITGAAGAGFLGAVAATGGPLGTAPVVITFPVGPVKVSIVDSTLNPESTVAVVKTTDGFIQAKNVTMANPTGATQAGGQMRKPAYRRDYKTKSTPAETYLDRDGTTLTPGGGVTATKSVR